MKSLLLTLCLIPCIATAGFTIPVNISESGDSAVITFSVNASTDVEVGVLDKDGKVVRHLAAGVLGGELPPPAPLQNSLSQRLVWDGLDDYGHRSFSGSFRVRVRTGLHPSFRQSISTRVFAAINAVTYGRDSVESADNLISMAHPVWKTGSGCNNLSDTSKIKFYGVTTQLDLTVSDETDEMIIQGIKDGASSSTIAPMVRLNGLTGAVSQIFSKQLPYPKPTIGVCPISVVAPVWGEPVIDWSGRYMLHDEGGWCSSTPFAAQNLIYRFNLDGTPAPFANGNTCLIQPPAKNVDLRQRGLATGPDGSIYYAHCGADTFIYQVVNKFDSSGNLVREKLITIYGNIGQGIRVDFKGNIFVGARVKPAGKPFPDSVAPFVTGQLLTDKYSQAYWADETYGSILKFGPEGGSVLPDKTAGTLVGGPYNTKVTATGMQWMHFGASFQPNHTSYRGSQCWCYAPRFDVDRFGRVIFPNPFENEFKALDNNGNPIFRIRNRDILSQVKIGLGHHVQATDRGVYLADHTNNQVVAFDWAADAETTVTLATAGTESGLSGFGGRGLTVFPNPFRPSVRLGFTINSRDFVTVRILEPSGRMVRNLETGVREPGARAVTWNGRDDLGRLVGAGVYLVSVQTGAQTLNRKILKVR